MGQEQSFNKPHPFQEQNSRKVPDQKNIINTDKQPPIKPPSWVNENNIFDFTHGEPDYTYSAKQSDSTVQHSYENSLRDPIETSHKLANWQILTTPSNSPTNVSPRPGSQARNTPPNLNSPVPLPSIALLTSAEQFNDASVTAQNSPRSTKSNANTTNPPSPVPLPPTALYSKMLSIKQQQPDDALKSASKLPKSKNWVKLQTSVSEEVRSSEEYDPVTDRVEHFIHDELKPEKIDTKKSDQDECENEKPRKTSNSDNVKHQRRKRRRRRDSHNDSINENKLLEQLRNEALKSKNPIESSSTKSSNDSSSESSNSSDFSDSDSNDSDNSSSTSVLDMSQKNSSGVPSPHVPTRTVVKSDEKLVSDIVNIDSLRAKLLGQMKLKRDNFDSLGSEKNSMSDKIVQIDPKVDATIYTKKSAKLDGNNTALVDIEVVGTREVSIPQQMVPITTYLSPKMTVANPIKIEIPKPAQNPGITEIQMSDGSDSDWDAPYFGDAPTFTKRRTLPAHTHLEITTTPVLTFELCQPPTFNSKSVPDSPNTRQQKTKKIMDRQFSEVQEMTRLILEKNVEDQQKSAEKYQPRTESALKESENGSEYENTGMTTLELKSHFEIAKNRDFKLVTAEEAQMKSVMNLRRDKQVRLKEVQNNLARFQYELNKIQASIVVSKDEETSLQTYLKEVNTELIPRMKQKAADREASYKENKQKFESFCVKLEVEEKIRLENERVRVEKELKMMLIEEARKLEIDSKLAEEKERLRLESMKPKTRKIDDVLKRTREYMSGKKDKPVPVKVLILSESVKIGNENLDLKDPKKSENESDTFSFLDSESELELGESTMKSELETRAESNSKVKNREIQSYHEKVLKSKLSLFSSNEKTRHFHEINLYDVDCVEHIQHLAEKICDINHNLSKTVHSMETPGSLKMPRHYNKIQKHALEEDQRVPNLDKNCEMCPFDINGECRDPECDFTHFSDSVKALPEISLEITADFYKKYDDILTDSCKNEFHKTLAPIAFVASHLIFIPSKLKNPIPDTVTFTDITGDADFTLSKFQCEMACILSESNVSEKSGIEQRLKELLIIVNQHYKNYKIPAETKKSTDFIQHLLCFCVKTVSCLTNRTQTNFTNASLTIQNLDYKSAIESCVLHFNDINKIVPPAKTKSLELVWRKWKLTNDESVLLNMCTVLRLEQNGNAILLILVKLLDFQEVVTRMDETCVLSEDSFELASSIAEQIGPSAQESVLWLFLFDLVDHFKVSFTGAEECVDRALRVIFSFENRLPVWLYSIALMGSGKRGSIGKALKQLEKCLSEEKVHITPEIKTILSTAFLFKCKQIIGEDKII